jgi:hypothetical protein
MTNNSSVDEWLEELPCEVQSITHELIATARRNMPNTHECIYHDAVGFRE